MKIDFNNLERSKLDNFKGGEKFLDAAMFFDGTNRIMHAKLISGASIGVHTHDTSSEIIYILSGNGHVIYDNQDIFLTAGECHYCAEGHTHTLINESTEDLVFFAVVANQ